MTRSTIKSLKSLQSERIISRISISCSLICYPIKPIMMLINAAYNVWCHLGLCHLCSFSTAYLISMSTTSNTYIKSARLKTGSQKKSLLTWTDSIVALKWALWFSRSFAYVERDENARFRSEHVSRRRGGTRLGSWGMKVYLCLDASTGTSRARRLCKQTH